MTEKTPSTTPQPNRSFIQIHVKAAFARSYAPITCYLEIEMARRGIRETKHPPIPLTVSNEFHGDDPFSRQFEKSLDPQFLHNATGQILKANASAIREFEGGNRELTSLSVSDLFPESLQHTVVDQVIQSLSEGELLYETIFTTNEGKIKRFLIHTIPLGENSDTSLTICKNTTTTHKLESLFAAIMSSSSDGFWVLDTDSRFLEVNDTFLEMTGYSRDELKSITFRDIVFESDRERLTKHLKVVRKKEQGSIGLSVSRKDGSTIFVDLNISYVDQGDQLYYGFIHDVSERFDIIGKLEESEWKFRALFEHGPIGIALHEMIYDRHGNPVDYRFLDANQNYQVLTGIDPRGKLVTEAFPGIENDPFDWIGTYAKVVQSDEILRIQQHLELSDQWFDIVAYRYKPDHFVAAFLNITDRICAINDLKISEEKYRNYIDHSPLAFFLIGESGRFHEVNDAASKLLGYDQDELLQLAIHEIDEALTPILLEKVLKILKHRGEYRGERDLLRKDGSIVHVDMEIALLSSSRIMGFCLDISERKQWEEELRINVDKFKTLFNSLQDAVFVHPWCEEGFANFVEVNDLACKRYGYTREEFFTIKAPDITVKQNADSHSQTSHRKRLLSESHMVFEAEHVTKNGRIFPVEINSNVITIDNQYYILAVVRDLTEQKQAEEALRSSEKRFRSVIEQSIEAIYLLNEDGRFAFVNDKFREYFNLTDEDLNNPNFSFLQLIDPTNHEMIQTRREHRKRGEELPAIYEFTARKLTGESFEVQTSTTQITIDGQESILGFIRDITKEKHLEAQLRQSQKMESIGHLAGGIAHDFNNLLTPILGNSELALLRTKPSDPLYQEMKLIRETAEHARDLTRQLLAFSRKQVLEFRPLNLNKLFTDFQKILTRTIREDITLIMEFEEDIPNILADPSQIEQIILNLCVNAQDAMPIGGKITIKTCKMDLDHEYAEEHPGVIPGRHVMFSVSDTGAGMDDETIAQIFDPFFSTKELGKGTGLGLSTVYGIIKQHNGNIWVYSEPGLGTTFKIYFPVAADDFVVPTDPIETITKTEGNELILVVEDQKPVLDMAIRFLKNAGYRIREANSGNEALQIITEEKLIPDLLLTDVIMPGMNGKELYDTIRQEMPDLKVLYMSGYTDEIIAHHGVLEENLFFLQKPFTLKSLTRKVRQVLDARID